MIEERLNLPDRSELMKLPEDGGREFNRLVFQQSPYLLQHARNPVNWFPWGEQAFQEARRLDRPIFLSIGYATCHWCHVMEHESFEDVAVANMMNDAFICIKVDREERPDVDHLYMAVCQALTGSGGWPLNVLLTPELKPFFAGTYFPKFSYPNRIGLVDLIPRIANAWSTQRNEIETSSQEISQKVLSSNEKSHDGSLSNEPLERAVQLFKQTYDPHYGGFGQAPKFPTPHHYRFLLRCWEKTRDTQILGMVTHTLTQMRLGGIFDHIGKGFHRYSTDREWLVPHFEKMLYDQALLAMAYLETYQVTGDLQILEVAREIFDYVRRDLTHPEGGFFSAEDADSEGEEGLFYIWDYSELKTLLAQEDLDLVAQVFQAKPKGNFRDEASGQPSGVNILYQKASNMELAKALKSGEDSLSKRLTTIKNCLFNIRQRRPRPLLDDKVLTDWNGLMMAALAKGYAVTGQHAYLQSAKKALEFIENHLVSPEGDLLKRFRNNEANLGAILEDYAFLALGCLELYQATFEVKFLESTLHWIDQALAKFWDQDSGAFFQSEDRPDLIARMKDLYDGAIPSGNSVMADVMKRLALLTGKEDLSQKSWAILSAFSDKIQAYAAGYTHALMALQLHLLPTREVVVVIPDDSPAQEIEALKRDLQRQFLPQTTFLVKTVSITEKLAELSPFTRDMAAVEGKTTYYVCQNFACQAPIHDKNSLWEKLGSD